MTLGPYTVGVRGTKFYVEGLIDGTYSWNDLPVAIAQDMRIRRRPVNGVPFVNTPAEAYVEQGETVQPLHSAVLEVLNGQIGQLLKG